MVPSLLLCYSTRMPQLNTASMSWAGREPEKAEMTTIDWGMDPQNLLLYPPSRTADEIMEMPPQS